MNYRNGFTAHDEHVYWTPKNTPSPDWVADNSSAHTRQAIMISAEKS